MIHNSFQLNKKLKKEQDINELKLRNSELRQRFLKVDKFTELTHRLNDISGNCKYKKQS